MVKKVNYFQRSIVHHAVVLYSFAELIIHTDQSQYWSNFRLENTGILL